MQRNEQNDGYVDRHSEVDKKIWLTCIVLYAYVANCLDT